MRAPAGSSAYCSTRRQPTRWVRMPFDLSAILRVFGPTAAALIQWLHRDLLRGGDAEIRRLLDELLGYPDVPRNWRTLDLDAPTTPFLAIEVQKDHTHLRFFMTLTTLGTPYDITLQELRIENFFPADDATDTALRRLNAG